MFPILLRIPRFGDLSTGAIVLELALGAACLLGWLYLRTKGRKEGAASWLNLGAFLVGAHVVFSQWMEGKITIFTFGVVIIVAFFLASAYILRHTRKMGLDDKNVFEARQEYLTKIRGEADWCVKEGYRDRIPIGFSVFATPHNAVK